MGRYGQGIAGKVKAALDTAIGKIEYANGLVILEGKKAITKAEELYSEATEHDRADAMERLYVELAKSEMEE